MLTIVHSFFKATHFVTLPKLPSTLETAQLVTDHEFRIHVIPVDFRLRTTVHVRMKYGMSFAPPLELRLVSQLVSILRAMAKQKSLTKSWRWHSGVVTSNQSTKHVPLLTETLAIVGLFKIDDIINHVCPTKSSPQHVHLQ